MRINAQLCKKKERKKKEKLHATQPSNALSQIA
jgi:hypothetical protein